MSSENVSNEAETTSFLVGALMGCAFIALSDRYGCEHYEECDSKDEAIRFLEYGSDEGMHMDIAVIDCSTNEMVWYNDFLGKKECQKRVDGFLRNHFH